MISELYITAPSEQGYGYLPVLIQIRIQHFQKVSEQTLSSECHIIRKKSILFGFCITLKFKLLQTADKVVFSEKKS